MATTVMGIDPGTRRAGIACICGNRVLACDVLKWTGNRITGQEALAEFEAALTDMLNEFQPTVVGVERPLEYVGKNTGRAAVNGHTCVMLGRVLGVVELWAYRHGLRLVIVAPSTAKKFACGNGLAPKDQVAMGVSHRFRREIPAGEAADSVAIALAASVIAQRSNQMTFPRLSKRREATVH